MFGVGGQVVVDGAGECFAGGCECYVAGYWVFMDVEYVGGGGLWCCVCVLIWGRRVMGGSRVFVGVC